jgi:hypothetical protein
VWRKGKSGWQIAGGSVSALGWSWPSCR